MQYVGGKPFTDHVRDNQLSTEETLRLFQGVCEAVDHVHQRGVIHRDLKPSHILVDSRDQQPYVLDYGLAKIGGVDSDQFSQLSLTGQIMGTPAYIVLADCPSDLRGWEWDWLHGRVTSAGITLLSGQEQPGYSSDGRTLVTAA